MPMYMWRSRYLAHYGRGYIFADAPSVEEARALALAKFEPHVREHRLFAYEGWKPDEDDLEDIERHLGLLKDELAEEPAVITNDALFVEGSD